MAVLQHAIIVVFVKPMPSKTSEYLMADEAEFPLGSIVFFFSVDSFYLKKGISHVGIVVGNESGSPQVAHATSSKTLKHAVISRLRKYKDKCEVEYIIFKPNQMDEQLLDRMVKIAKELSTTSENDKAIVPYSESRFDSMNSFTKKLFQECHETLKMPEKFIIVMNKQIEKCKGDFNEYAWLSSFAKMLNLQHIRHPGKDKFYFTKKGMHCVQFVTTVFQMAELEDNAYKSLYKIDERKKFRFSAKHKKLPFSYEYQKVTLAENYIPKALLPLSGKSLSPAALLFFLTFIPDNDVIKFTMSSSIMAKSKKKFSIIMKSLRSIGKSQVDQLKIEELDICALSCALIKINNLRSSDATRMPKRLRSDGDRSNKKEKIQKITQGVCVSGGR